MRWQPFSYWRAKLLLFLSNFKLSKVNSNYFGELFIGMERLRMSYIFKAVGCSLNVNSMNFSDCVRIILLLSTSLYLF